MCTKREGERERYNPSFFFNLSLVTKMGLRFIIPTFSFGCFVFFFLGESRMSAFLERRPANNRLLICLTTEIMEVQSNGAGR